MRIGFGIDFHRFCEGDHIMLCGIRIPHSHGIDAHSDGDVAMHAITDAILGAICEGDVGMHFSDKDPKWSGADSTIFLRHAMVLMEKHGYKLQNIDITIICEAPRILAYRDAMTNVLSQIFKIDDINIKATTTEQMGAMGRKEGISAMANVLLGKINEI